MSFSKSFLKSAAAVALFSVASLAMAKGTASNPVSLGLLGDEDTQFSNSFNSGGTFTDYYSFSIGANSNGAAGSTFDTAWNFFVTGVDVTKITLSGGTLGSALVDNSPNSFIFTGLGTGTYLLTVSGKLTDGLFSGDYNGTIHAINTAPTTPTAPVASPAPEPADFAMALMGLAGVGYMVRRRSAR